MKPEPFTAIILAGDRSPGDPLVKTAGVCCKALVPVHGKPMVQHVLEVLEQSHTVSRLVLCGPPWEALAKETALMKAVNTERCRWLESRTSPSRSAAAAMATIPENEAILMTTADHALLRQEIVDYFCTRAHTSKHDVLVALTDYDQVIRTYPNTRRTALRFRDGNYSGCNMFAFNTPRARDIAQFWTRIESQRKNPLRVISAAGWLAVLRYLCGRLSLEAALHSISTRLGLKIGAVILPFPEAAVDIDTIADWALVKEITGRTRTSDA